MASTIKKCRVCGREYEACHTLSNTPGVFRWQDVACSQECGAIYLAKINASRGNSNVEKPVDIATPIIETETSSCSCFNPIEVKAEFDINPEPVTEFVIYDCDDDEDEEDEEFFDDDEEEIM